ncbi:hypothetical protein Daus18300_004855 [Diaporthe australafricana]|uniref:Aminoglycoside phosphotransferase domain-containing protein n=1 Tax=Diaporthe australafricana TaxID=127596 RepID=A0ABR3X641_9PEZI
MAGDLRERDQAMYEDREALKRDNHTRDQWKKFALVSDRLKPIYKLVYRHYKGGKQKLVDIGTPVHGSFNLNWRFGFETGSAMFHVPFPGSTKFFDEKIRAEVATMKMIEERTIIPVPHIYHWDYAADNPTGLGPFIIMDYIEHERDLTDLIAPRKGDSSQENQERGIDPNIPEDTFLKHNNAVEGPDDCRDKYMARQLFRKLAKQGAFLEPDEHQQPFKFWCGDLRPSSVLLNKENEVVGVIDWEFSYFAPASFSYDPPWWLLVRRGEYWDKGMENFYEEFDRRVPLFLRAMELVEEQLEKAAESEQNDVEDSALSFYLEQLELADEQPKTALKLSHQMRKNWENGRHYINYASQNSWAFDAYFWMYIDQRFFGANSRGGFEDRLHLLSPSEREKMEEFVGRKIEQKNDRKFMEWDENECKEYMRTLLEDC